MRRRAHRYVAVVVSAASLVAVASCRTPTQVTLVMSTDLPCPSTRGLAITGAAVGQAERGAPSTISYRCEGAGDLGTLVVTPAHEKNGDVAFRLVMGIDTPAEQCKPPDYKGCIVQRRILSFLPNTELELPIRMLLVCKDVPCDELSTCAASGSCVSARIPDPEDCVPPKQCLPVGDSPVTQPPGSIDGGPTTLPDGAPLPEAGGDAATDAATDAGGDHSVPPNAGDRYCPPDALSCPSGPCCWDRALDRGACMSGQACGPQTVQLRCTRRVDCAALGSNYACCTDDTNFAYADCIPKGACLARVCMTDADCVAPQTCDRSASTLSPPNGVFGLCK